MSRMRIKAPRDVMRLPDHCRPAMSTRCWRDRTKGSCITSRYTAGVNNQVHSTIYYIEVTAIVEVELALPAVHQQQI